MRKKTAHDLFGSAPVHIVCCIPVVIDPEVKAMMPKIEITDLYVKGRCAYCDCEIWIGPRAATRDDFHKCCMRCVILEFGATQIDGDFGGGVGVEGNPIQL